MACSACKVTSCSPHGLLFPGIDHLAKVSTGSNQAEATRGCKNNLGFDQDVSSRVELRPAVVLAQHWSQRLYRAIEQCRSLAVWCWIHCYGGTRVTWPCSPSLLQERTVRPQSSLLFEQ